MSEELKACPFCGGPAILLYGLEGEYAVGCSDDNCEFCGEDSRDNQKVIAQWNTRPIEDNLRLDLATKDAEIERLRQELDNKTFEIGLLKKWADEDGAQ